jgi:hypothetical protein
MDVYLAYPDQDLLPIKKPNKGELVGHWLVRCKRELENCGDTLFLFVLREMSDAKNDVNEAAEMLQRALFDLEAVRDAIGDL